MGDISLGTWMDRSILCSQIAFLSGFVLVNQI